MPLLRHQPIEVERLRYVEVPSELTRPVEVPLLGLSFVNGLLLSERDAFAEGLRQCNGRLDQIAGIQGRPVDDR